MSDALVTAATEPDAISWRTNLTIAASIPGRYVLTRHFDAKGKRREFSCRVVRISPDELTLAAPVYAPVGERVIATLLEFGTFEGKVLKTHQSGFVMGLTMSDAEREKFAAKIEWYDKHKNRGVPDNRRARRIVPQSPQSVVLLADGTMVGAFVIDISVSGVAISAQIEPRIGEPLAVGKIVGRVVRRFAGGFGIAFVEPQDPQSLEKMLLPPASS